MSNTRPLSKSTLSEPDVEQKRENPVVGSPPSAPSSPAQKFTSPSPRKNGRRRYTSRQVPPSPYRAPPTPLSTPPPSSTPPVSEVEVSYFLALTEQLNGKMDGLVEYHLIGGRWESGMLYIDLPTNSLNRHYGSEGSFHRLIPDLRGCRVDKVHSEDGRSVLAVKPTSSPELVLRPPLYDVEKWFAALYRWRTVTRAASTRSRRSSLSNKSMSSPPAITTIPRRPLDIKIGSMVLLPSRRVKTILKDNGVLSILAEAGQRGDEELLLYSIHLYTLQRSAIQPVDPSISAHPFSFVIHARLRESGVGKSFEMRKVPLYLTLETRMQMEVWLVLLKCYATPELHGPPSLDPLDTFRCHRSLSLRINEGRKLRRPVNSGDSIREKEMDSYCEILVEGEIRGKTNVKRGTLRPLWTEDFQFSDLPEHIDDVSIHLRYVRRNRDLLLGKVSLNILDTELGATNQAWHPVISTSRDGLSVERVGELDLKYKLEELVILMSCDYAEIRKLLLDFDNNLTVELGKTIQDLDSLAERLVHIFLADNMSVQWLISLATDEITVQFTQLKSQTTPPLESAELQSEGAEAHQKQALKQEATRTLFRGNTLLTKSLMKFMEKVGRDYLEETLGTYLRHVVASHESCEVDPSHLKLGEDLQENWTRLLKHIRAVWDRILASAASCPREFKEIFSKIQELVVERAGNVPTITYARYTCISAFIFLRFFMPACLNPSICGIIREPPDEKTRRTLLLISKGLQGVSNMSGYGGKEKWILPMGTLSAEYEDRFTAFINDICVAPGTIAPSKPAQYSGPAMVKGRLDFLSQEGIPTLPFLIDQPREFAGLVKLWNRQCLPTSSTNQTTHHTIDISKLSDAGRAFHTACVQLNLKTVSLVETAVEREEEELSESEVVEDDLAAGVAEMSVQPSPITRLSKREVYRKPSFSHDDGDDGTNSSKRGLESVWTGFRRKRSEKERNYERDKI